jgi:hypothetical protein
MKQVKKGLGALSMLAVMLFLTACGEKALDDSPTPAAVTNLSYEKTNGGAIISYTLPVDENLLFVRANYVNSQNKEVSKVSSGYDNKIEIDGFADLSPRTIKLYSVGRNGKESAAASIEVVPDTSYIELIRRNLQFESILGGVRATWYTPSDKTVFVYVDYTEVGSGRASQRILSSSRMDTVRMNIKGLDSIPYNFTVTVEDFSNNKTESLEKGTFTPRPELKIPKAGWKLFSGNGGNSANGDYAEGKSVNFFDDIIDTRDSGTDNSYFIVRRDNNGGSLMFFNDITVSNGKPLMMIVDMGAEYMISRIMCWQRAYDYANRIDDTSGISSTYAYYKDDNLKSFLFYATDNANEITNENIWNNYLMVCDFGGPFEDGYVPASKIQEAVNGHEFEFPDMMGPYRYFVMGLTATYGSEIQACFSEISLYGVEYK